ncbi:MAG: DUF6326 family protein [Bacteroidota bacterium]
MDTKVKLSTLWILVLFNMIFADIFSFIVELKQGGILDIPGEVNIIMAIAAILTNIPIFMIFLSRILPYRSNKIVNMIAGIFTIIYIIGGGSWLPHYLIIASIEVALLLVIIRLAFRWKDIVT